MIYDSASTFTCTKERKRRLTCELHSLVNKNLLFGAATTMTSQREQFGIPAWQEVGQAHTPNPVQRSPPELSSLSEQHLLYVHLSIPPRPILTAKKQPSLVSIKLVSDIERQSGRPYMKKCKNGASRMLIGTTISDHEHDEAGKMKRVSRPCLGTQSSERRGGLAIE